MKVGLVRHFKVLQEYRNFKWVRSSEFNEWQESYDTADIEPGNPGSVKDNWDICFSSDLPRAVKTAEYIYKGEIIKTHLLREISVRSFVRGNIKLPFLVWTILARIAWFFSHKSQPEGRVSTKKRVEEFVSRALSCNKPNILVVSHGALMWVIRKELINRGFKGKRFLKVPNGALYVYKRRA
jgi:broad specificity phosphatase PhoE